MNAARTLPALVAIALCACGAGSGAPGSDGGSPKNGDAGAAGPVAAAGRPTDTKDLAGRIEAALHAGDVDAYMALMPTADEVNKHCPALSEELANKMPRLIERGRKAFADCLKDADWSVAKLEKFEIGDKREAASDCDGTVFTLDDLLLEFSAGPLRYKVEISDVAVLPTGLVIGTGPECGNADAPKP